MTEQPCLQCSSTEFLNIVHLMANSDGKITEIVDTTIAKCSNCGARYQITDGSLTVLESAPQGSRAARVRSSVTAVERGKDLGGGSRF